METREWNWITKDGLQVYSQGWLPKGDIKAVVCLLHGLGEHTGRYAHVGDALTKKRYALVGFDMRGHGKSGGRRGHTPSLSAYFDDLDIFLKQVAINFPHLPLFLYGHSYGGILALVYPTLRNPRLLGVIATAASMRSSLGEQKLKVALVRILGSIVPTITLSSGLDPKTLSRDPRVVNAYINDPLVHKKVTLGFGRVSLETIQKVYQNASLFAYPLLIMHGAQDKLGHPSGSQEFAQLVHGDCTLQIWNGLYHEIHNEPEKNQVFKVMIDWMDKHLK